MAKNRNKKKNKEKKDGAVSMDVSFETLRDAPQPMDTSDGKTLKNSTLGVISRKMKKPVTKAKNLRKLKGVARAIAKTEKTEEKMVKNKSRILRIQSAKSLYD